MTRNGVTAMSQQLTALRAILAEYPACHCDFPEDGEEGIVYDLPCRIRDELGLGACKLHAARVSALEIRTKRTEPRA